MFSILSFFAIIRIRKEDEKMKSKIIILGILLTSFLVLGGGGILSKTIPEQRES